MYSFDDMQEIVSFDSSEKIDHVHGGNIKPNTYSTSKSVCFLDKEALTMATIIEDNFIYFEILWL